MLVLLYQHFSAQNQTGFMGEVGLVWAQLSKMLSMAVLMKPWNVTIYEPVW